MAWLVTRQVGEVIDEGCEPGTFDGVELTGKDEHAEGVGGVGEFASGVGVGVVPVRPVGVDGVQEYLGEVLGGGGAKLAGVVGEQSSRASECSWSIQAGS